MSESLTDLEALAERSQGLLIDFLFVDLDLAFTFLRTAKLKKSTDANHCEAALRKARAALDAVRHFQERITDESERHKIQARSDKLQADIDAFQECANRSISPSRSASRAASCQRSKRRYGDSLPRALRSEALDGRAGLCSELRLLAAVLILMPL
jgi:hypothetical protein